LIGLSVMFDTWRLDAVPSIWARLVGWSPQAIRVAAAMAVALLVIDGRRLAAGFKAAASPAPSRRWSALGLHLIVVGAFAALTSRLVNGDVVGLAHRPLWTLAWIASAALAAAAWCAALLPVASWRVLLFTRPGTLAGAVMSGTAVWASGFVTQDAWAPMAPVTFRGVAALLGLFTNQLVVDPSRLLIGTTRFKVFIAPACSGYEGVGLILVFLSLYLWLFRKDLRFPAALILLPLGAVTIWLVNIVRIVALIAIGSAGWQAVAAGGFHSQAGWIAFNAIAIAFVALTVQVNAFSRVDRMAATRDAPDHVDDLTIPLLAPFVAFAAATMVTRAFSAGFDWLYPLRVMAVGVVLWRYRATYLALVRSWTWSWWPVAAGVVTAWVFAARTTGFDRGLWFAATTALPRSAAIVWMIGRAVGYVAVAPIVEELAFRGYLMRRFQTATVDADGLGRFSPVAVVGSSLVFGALHGHLWVAGTIAGLAFAAVFCRRRRITDAILAHAMTNGCLALYACTTGHWSVWS
jgi:exosortase E/protease (VPEID-CTERM system)